jgi:serine/threonine protein kinase
MAMGATGSIEYTVGEPMRGTKWVVRGKLGQGGMGLVLDVVKARVIPGAMKVLLPPFANLPEFAAKFLDEVRVTARLQHPNVVQVLDFDRLEDGTPFMVMERLRGRTLRAALRETQKNVRTWTPANAYAVAAQIAQGLYRAHSHRPSIVHRDIKPENIYLHRAEGTLESVVKVMDFGVAAMVGERDRERIGTPRSMAPEQLAGDPVSPQTDQYALALVVYEMLTGRFPWEVNLRDIVAVVDVHLRVAPTPPSRFCPWLPERIDAALLKALSKDPTARHDTVHGLVFELRSLQSIDRGPSNVAGDAYTDPMVGTLADGGAVVLDENDTFERMPASSLSGPSLVISELSGPSESSAKTAQRPERTAEVQASAPQAPSTKEAPDAASEHAGGGDGERTPAESEGRTEAPDERSTMALAPLDTPMTGEAERALKPIRGKASVRRVPMTAFALAGAGALLAVLLSVWKGGSPREPLEPQNAFERPPSVAEAARIDSQPEPARAPTGVTGEPSAATESTTPSATVPATKPRGAPATGARPDGGAGGGPLRKVTPIASARAPGAPPPKAFVPDDGRDELYIPGAQ